MDPTENPRSLALRFCQQKNVEPIEVLGCLLSILQHSHMMTAIATGFQSGAENKANVFSEISGVMQIAGSPNEIPASMLAAICDQVAILRRVDVANAKTTKEHNRPQQTIVLERQALVKETLLLTIKEVLNIADRHSIESQLNLEDMAKKEGWKLFDTETPNDQANFDEENE
jgi:hypothetical protein